MENKIIKNKGLSFMKSKSIKKLKQKTKTRPTCKKDEKQYKKQVQKNAKYQHIQLWIEKLDNFHVILTAQDGMMGQILDDFEKDFESNRKDLRVLKDMLKERSTLLEKMVQKNDKTIQLKYNIEKKIQDVIEGQKSLESLLKKKKKKYKQEELHNKMERVDRLKTNFDVLKDLYSDQNTFEQKKFGGKVFSQFDIENQMVFSSKKYNDEQDMD